MTGLEIKRLDQIHLGDEGYLYEALRADDPIFEGKFGQNLISLVNPWIKKGLHLHHQQTDYTTCLTGNILYVAIREIPGEVRKVQKHIVGEKNRILIKTPPGIWHGYVAIGNEQALVLYTMDKPYDSNNPDTEEVELNHFGREIWDIDDGLHWNPKGGSYSP